MTKHATRGVIFIHSVSPTVQPHVEWAVSSVLGYEVHFEWTTQPAQPSMNRAEISWVTEDCTAVTEGGRWSATPGLGIFYAQTDIMGNVVIPENRIRAAVELAGGDPDELRRLIDLALGQAWDDELEPFRYAGAGAPVRWLHRVG